MKRSRGSCTHHFLASAKAVEMFRKASGVARMWDHALEPKRMFLSWAQSPQPGGILTSSTDRGHESIDNLNLFGATRTALRRLVGEATSLVPMGEIRGGDPGGDRFVLPLLKRASLLPRMLDAEAQVTVLSRSGRAAAIFNSNMMINEDEFRPLDQVAPEADAVYNARFDSAKRHDLARQLDSVLLITFRDYDQSSKRFMQRNGRSPS